MNTGDKVYIRNSAGLLEIELQKQLSTVDVSQCQGDDAIAQLQKPRLEFHKRNGGWMITLCNRQSKLPSKIICAFLEDDELEIFEGEFDANEQEEENIFETVLK